MRIHMASSKPCFKLLKSSDTTLLGIEKIEAELGRELELDFPPADDVEKVERCLISEEKKSLKKPGMLKKGKKA